MSVLPARAAPGRGTTGESMTDAELPLPADKVSQCPTHWWLMESSGQRGQCKKCGMVRAFLFSKLTPAQYRQSLRVAGREIQEAKVATKVAVIHPTPLKAEGCGLTKLPAGVRAGQGGIDTCLACGLSDCRAKEAEKKER